MISPHKGPNDAHGHCDDDTVDVMVNLVEHKGQPDQKGRACLPISHAPAQFWLRANATH